RSREHATIGEWPRARREGERARGPGARRKVDVPRRIRSVGILPAPLAGAEVDALEQPVQEASRAAGRNRIVEGDRGARGRARRNREGLGVGRAPTGGGVENGRRGRTCRREVGGGGGRRH